MRLENLVAGMRTSLLWDSWLSPDQVRRATPPPRTPRRAPRPTQHPALVLQVCHKMFRTGWRLKRCRVTTAFGFSEQSTWKIVIEARHMKNKKWRKEMMRLHSLTTFQIYLDIFVGRASAHRPPCSTRSRRLHREVSSFSSVPLSHESSGMAMLKSKMMRRAKTGFNF